MGDLQLDFFLLLNGHIGADRGTARAI
jgi:hypothetical protein